MTQKDKELLLKDLCARLPYGVVLDSPNPVDDLWDEAISIDASTKTVTLLYNERVFYIDEVKPYLLPLSSITEEQYIEFITISGWNCDITDIRRGKFSCISYIGLDYIYNTIDWLNKNHFDYRGLIEKGLAIDATGLNIY